MHYRHTCEKLEQEKTFYLTSGPPYRRASFAKEALDNPGVDPRLTSKSLAASRMLRVLVEVFQSFPNEDEAAFTNFVARVEAILGADLEQWSQSAIQPPKPTTANS